MILKAIAFSTNDFYAKQSLRLEASLTKYGIPYEIRRLEHPGSWHKAVSMKPRFIRDMLAETSLDGVLYLDADAEVVAPLPLSELDQCDVAYTEFKRSKSHPLECLTGTMFFRKSQGVLAFLDAWSERVPIWRHSQTPEQGALMQTLIETNHGLRLHDLGPVWTYIHDDFKELFPDVKPLIMHYQASREYRERELRDERAKAKAQGQP